MKKLVFSLTAVAVLLVLAVPAMAAWASPDEMLAAKTEILEQRVEEGVITQEQADEILTVLEERAATCDGIPDEDRERLGQTYGQGLGFGRNGQGKGLCNGTGNGFGRGGNR